MEERIDISKRDLLAAYDDADSDGKALLEKLYGKAIFAKDITERVKTFEDALEVLGEVHCFVSEYNTLVNSGLIHSLSPDFVAYLKLRIITAALNEGWEPQFTVDEYRYYPWFDFYTQKEIDEMDEEDRSRVVGRASTLRMRMAVAFVRARATLLRARIRAAVRVSPSRHVNSPFMLASSLLKFGLTLCSVQKQRKQKNEHTKTLQLR